MTAMKYFTRAQLAGNNLPRNTRATLHGSVKCNVPDGVSPVPYIAGAASKNFRAVFNGTHDITATLTSTSFTQILADLNTAFAGYGQALDTNGSITLQAIDTTPSPGSVEVLVAASNDGSTTLGFDLTAGRLRATDDDLPDSPEGGVGNLPHTAFPAKYESLTTASFARGLGRLAANGDVLYSDSAKGVAKLTRIGNVGTDVTLDATGTFLTPPAATRIYSFGPTASNPSSPLRVLDGGSPGYSKIPKEGLQPYFAIVDKDTNLISASCVVAVFHIPPVTLTPSTYAMAPTWATGGCTLGVDLAKSTGIAISSISNGRLIKTAAPFSAQAVPGDYLEITGATNTTQWNNNGYRWVIESIVDTSTLIVRPMSSAEMAELGISVDDNEPLLELNSTKSNVQSWGSITIHTGNATSHSTLGVWPPLSQTGNYELWAAVPTSSLDERAYSPSSSELPTATACFSDAEVGSSALLTVPTLTSDDPYSTSPAYHYTSFYVRRHDRLAKIPAGSVPASFSDPDSTNDDYLYWDAGTNSVGVEPVISSSTVFNDPEVTPLKSDTYTRKFPLGLMHLNGGVVTVTPMGVTADDHSRHVITVGTAGNCQTLEEAVNYLNTLATLNAETGVHAGGEYNHAEIVLLQDTVLTSGLRLKYPGVVIRGANQEVYLTVTSGYLSPYKLNQSLVIKDLVVNSASANNYFIGPPVYAGGNLLLKNVRSAGTPLKYFVYGGSSGFASARIEGCTISVLQGLYAGAVTKQTVLDSTVIVTAASTTDAQLFTASTSGIPNTSALTTTEFTLERSKFQGLYASDLSNPLGWILPFGATASLKNCSFSFSSSLAAGATLAMFGGARAVVDNCTVSGTSGDGTVSQFCGGAANILTKISGGSYALRPLTGTSGLNKISEAEGVTVTGVDCPDGSSSGTLLEGVRVTKCSVGGVAKVGISSYGTYSRVEDNTVSLTVGANNGSSCKPILCATDGSIVRGNVVTSTTLTDAAITVTGDNDLVEDNTCTFNYLGVYPDGSTGLKLVRNRLVSSVTTAAGVRISGTISLAMTENVISLSGTSSIGINSVGTPTGVLTLRNNSITAFNPLLGAADLNWDAQGDTYTGAINSSLHGKFVGSTFTGSNSFSGSTEIRNNKFLQGTTAGPWTVTLYSDTDLLTFASNNVLDGVNVRVRGEANTELRVNDCFVTGTVTTPTGNLGNFFASDTTFTSVSLVPSAGHDKSAVLRRCRLTSDLTVGAHVSSLTLDDVTIAGNLARTAPSVDGYTKFSNVSVAGTSALAGFKQRYLDCEFSAAVLTASALGAGKSIHATRCTFSGLLTTAGEVHLNDCSATTGWTASGAAHAWYATDCSLGTLTTSAGTTDICLVRSSSTDGVATADGESTKVAITEGSSLGGGLLLLGTGDSLTVEASTITGSIAAAHYPRPYTLRDSRITGNVVATYGLIQGVSIGGTLSAYKTAVRDSTVTGTTTDLNNSEFYGCELADVVAATTRIEASTPNGITGTTAHLVGSTCAGNVDVTYLSARDCTFNGDLTADNLVEGGLSGCKCNHNATIGQAHGGSYSDILLNVSSCYFAGSHTFSAQGKLTISDSWVKSNFVMPAVVVAPLHALVMANCVCEGTFTANSLHIATVSDTQFAQAPSFLGNWGGTPELQSPLFLMTTCNFNGVALTVTDFILAKVDSSNPSAIPCGTNGNVEVNNCTLSTFSRGAPGVLMKGCTLSGDITITAPGAWSDNITLVDTYCRDVTISEYEVAYVYMRGCTGRTISLQGDMSKDAHYEILGNTFERFVSLARSYGNCVLRGNNFNVNGNSGVEVRGCSADAGHSVTIEGNQVTSYGADSAVNVVIQVNPRTNKYNMGDIAVQNNAISVTMTGYPSHSIAGVFLEMIGGAEGTEATFTPPGSFTMTGNKVFGTARWLNGSDTYYTYMFVTNHFSGAPVGYAKKFKLMLDANLMVWRGLPAGVPDPPEDTKNFYAQDDWSPDGDTVYRPSAGYTYYIADLDNARNTERAVPLAP